MSVLARESADMSKVFDDLCLSRRVPKRAEGTQTPPQGGEVPLSGELPDQCVTSLIEMLTPSLRQHGSSKSASHDNSHDESSESSPLLAEVAAISVDRTRSKTKRVLIRERSSTVAMKEVFEELCLSRKKTSYTMTSDHSSTEVRQDGEVPDEVVSSMIEILRPSICQLSKNNGVSARREKSKDKLIRTYQSDPNIGPLPKPNVSSTMSEVSLDSIFTTPSNLTDTIDENLIKKLLSSQHQMDKDFVEAGSNTESSNRQCRKKCKKKRKKSKVKLIKDSGTETIYQTEDSTNQTEDLSSRETEDIIEDRTKPKNSSKTVEIKEQCNLSIEVEKRSSKEAQLDNNITVLRNRTDWIDTPFLNQESSETIEESTSNVDSEPTRGCPSALQYKIQFNSAAKKSSDTKTEIKRIKAILHTGKRTMEKKDGEYNRKKEFEYGNMFSKPTANTCNATIPYGISPLDTKVPDRMFPSHSSLSSPETTTATSLTSLRTYSCGSSYGEDNLVKCCCSNALTESQTPSEEPKVFWAITKINVYPDDSRTYEVMPLTGKKPAELPENSESVFVLIPPKLSQFVPSNFE